MFWEKKLSSWINSTRSQLALPLRVQLWNGRHFDLSARAPEVTIRVPRPSALVYLLNPSLANLGQAYVEGKLEVEGHLKAIIDVANALARTALHT
jgi:cyclopropane-fatty-acyl-phospholipid synthase